MKSYPKISGEIANLDIFAFDKLDGSNIRAEWSKKRGFYKFGTRKQMIDERAPIFGEAVGLIKGKYEQDVADAMKSARLDKGVFFFEFLGQSSFAGWHSPDEAHDVTLFDANLHRLGMLPPKEYLKMFGHLDMAPLLYRGKPNEQFLKQVRDGTLAGMTYEGVICKAPHPKKGKSVLMFKVKNQAWYEALRLKCAGDDSLYVEKA